MENGFDLTFECVIQRLGRMHFTRLIRNRYRKDADPFNVRQRQSFCAYRQSDWIGEEA
jgi:hypothetical protein